MSAKILQLDCNTALDLPCDRVLEGAKGKLALAIVIGEDKNGDPYFASSTADIQLMFWWAEKLKQELFNGDPASKR